MNEITLDASVAAQPQDLVISSNDVNSFLAELCELSAVSLSDALGHEVSCAVTLSRHHRTTTAAWSNPQARLFDEIQHSFGEGPCLHAMTTGTTVLIRTRARTPGGPNMAWRLPPRDSSACWVCRSRWTQALPQR
jgi:hypothetical protein